MKEKNFNGLLFSDEVMKSMEKGKSWIGMIETKGNVICKDGVCKIKDELWEPSINPRFRKPLNITDLTRNKEINI